MHRTLTSLSLAFSSWCCSCFRCFQSRSNNNTRCRPHRFRLPTRLFHQDRHLHHSTRPALHRPTPSRSASPSLPDSRLPPTRHTTCSSTTCTAEHCGTGSTRAMSSSAEHTATRLHTHHRNRNRCLQDGRSCATQQVEHTCSTTTFDARSGVFQAC